MNSHMQSQELPELPVVDLLLRWRRVPAVPAEDEAGGGDELLLRRRAGAQALRLVLLLLLLLPVPRGVRRVLRRVLRAVPALLVRLRLPAVLLVVVRLPRLRRRRVLRPALLPVPMMTIGEERLIEHISFFFGCMRACCF